MVMNPSWWVTSKEKAEDLPEAIRRTIEQENACDLALYDHARQAHNYCNSGETNVL